MLLTRRHLVIGLVLALALISMGDVAAEAGTIYACANRAGIVRVVHEGQRCLPGEHPLSWNQQGPQGLPGAQGPQGPQGLPGPQGPSGMTGLERVCERWSGLECPNPDGCELFLECPAGKQVLGGGAVSFKNEYYMIASVPSGNGWFADFRNSGNATTPTTIDVCVICASVAE